MFRPADLRRESTNVYCDLERAVLQITINSRERIRRLLFRRPASRWHFGIAQKSILAVKSLERRPLHHFKLNTSRQPRLKRTEFPAPFFPLLTPPFQFSSVQSLSRVRLFVTPWTAARQASLSITSSRSSLKLTSIQSGMPSNHVILCRPLLLPPSIFPSIRVFSNESVLQIRWPKYWSLTFSISLSNNIQS